MDQLIQVEKLKALNAKIPSFECIPGCLSCCGAVPFSSVEWARVPVKKQKPVGRAPTLQCLYACEGAGCEIYPIRPFICRLFGTVDEPRMTCPHGRGPEKKFTAEEGQALIEEYFAITGADQDAYIPNLNEREALTVAQAMNEKRLIDMGL